jgi:hypothetical protein
MLISSDFEYESENGQSFCGNMTGTSSVVEFGPSVKELTFEFVRSSNESFYNVTVRQIDCGQTQKLSDGSLDEYDKNAEPKVDQFRAPEAEDSCNKNIDAREFLVQSPGYPSSYPNNQDCIITVYPAGDNICSLEIRYN